MGRKSITITVEHNGNTRKVKTTSELREEITDVIYKTTVKAIGNVYQETLKKSFGTLAIFLQRLITRTPMDEDYNTNNPKHPHHKPDKDFARRDWYITDQNKTIMSGELIDSGAECKALDNTSDIKIILDKLISTFGLHDNDFIIGNANEHAGVLEYGGGNNWVDGEISEGKERSHGVKNDHSVQAPAGMFRISLIELHEGIEVGSNIIKVDKYGNYDPKLIEKYAKTLKQTGIIKTEDIERLV